MAADGEGAIIPLELCAGVGGPVPTGACDCEPWPPVVAGRLCGEEWALETLPPLPPSSLIFALGDGGGIMAIGLFCACGPRFPGNGPAPGRDCEPSAGIGKDESADIVDAFGGIKFETPADKLFLWLATIL